MRSSRNLFPSAPPGNPQHLVLGIRRHHFAANDVQSPPNFRSAYIMNSNALSMEHLLRKPLESRRAYQQRRRLLALGMLFAALLAGALAILLLGCGGGTPNAVSAPTPTPVSPLSAQDVK